MQDAFLAYLRGRLGAGVAYRTPPRPLTGGFMTDVYAFELSGAPDEWSESLVLRIYPADTTPESIARERCAQEVVSAQGLPAPRVLACEPAGALDRPFMVMEFLEGRPQLVIELPAVFAEVPRLFTLPKRHAAAMHLVHSLDTEPLLRSFAAAGIDRRAAGLEHWLDGAEKTIDRWTFDGLRPGLEWLRANRPSDPDRLSICHGDLFGANILERHGRVTGIIDWNLVTVGDRAFDLGGQLAGFEMSAMPGPRIMQLLSMAFGRMLARGLRRRYGRYQTISPAVIEYYSALRAFTELTFKVGMEAEVRETSIERRMATWRTDQCARYFERRTGVHLELPD